ncbi:MAG: sodium transporter [Desulfobulbus propionicus]|nr:MAG: sodium transporter [Desulfobulbus propionicus]
MTSPLIPASFTVVLGLVMLVFGGELLIQQASRLARRLGMTPFVIGLTIVAFGTSVPELFISLTASLQGHPGIMIGNIIGSNIANVGLILGCCSLLAPLSFQFKKIRTELFIVLSASVIVMLCSRYGLFPRMVGILFVLTLLSYIFFTYLNHHNDQHTSKTDTKEQTMLSRIPAIILLMVVGLALLGLGSTTFIQGAVTIARYFDVSELVIGLTLAAVGTSLPELASSIAALRQKQAGMLIGNVVGSNMFNLLMVLGLAGTASPFSLEKALLGRDLPIMFAYTAILVPMLHPGGEIKRWHGLVLLGSYIVYCLSLL